MTCIKVSTIVKIRFTILYVILLTIYHGTFFNPFLITIKKFSFFLH